MKIVFPHFYRTDRVSSEALIADLQAASAANNNNALTIAIYKKLGNYTQGVVTHRFGGWNKALKAAGLQTKVVTKVSVIELFDNLSHVWKTLGRQPQRQDLCPPLSQFGPSPYRVTFGSWGGALRKFAAFVNEYEITEAKRPLSDFFMVAGSRSLTDEHVTCRTIGWRFRHLVMKRDHFRCKACGASPAKDPSVTLHVDHIVPWSKGGESVIENLQTLCEMCNIGKGDMV